MQPVESKREKLEDLPGVIFVRNQSRGQVRLVVAEHVEVATHRGMEGDVLQELADVAECAVEKSVIIIGNRIGPIV